jgi:ferredoxin/flavodoxin
MRINIVYFTSTGNTLWLANKAKEIIEQLGHEVKLYEVIKDGEDFIRDKCDMLGVFHPVWGFLPPDPLWKFLRDKMPEGNGKKIFFIGDCAGIAGDTGMMCKKLIDSKGYNAFYINHIIMPTNFFLPWMPFNYWKKVPLEEQLKKILANAEKRLQKMCTSVLNFESRLEGTGLFWKCMGWFQRKMEFIVNFYKKKFSIAGDRCFDCGLCLRICPTGNISKNKNGEIVFGSKCIMCVKCYNLCPKDAILICDKTINDKKYKRYKGPSRKIKPVLYRK